MGPARDIVLSRKKIITTFRSTVELPVVVDHCCILHQNAILAVGADFRFTMGMTPLQSTVLYLYSRIFMCDGEQTLYSNTVLEGE